MSDKRAQGRPARGASTVGPQKIVEGLQLALRNLRTSNVTRKDIARFAGVTPALVTYYFPERSALTEAATVPVVIGLSKTIKDRLMEETDSHGKLLNIASAILSFYISDIAIIELYVSHRQSVSDDSVPDEVKTLSDTITEFFRQWLSSFPECNYDAQFLTNALLGICRSVAYHCSQTEMLSDPQRDHDSFILDHAEMICRILVNGLSGATIRELCRGDFLNGAENAALRRTSSSLPEPIEFTRLSEVRQAALDARRTGHAAGSS